MHLKGLDLLFVMRHLDEFITDYSYDMQNQEFFKKIGKKMETLTVNHMNALRTNGIGIVYIAVSFSDTKTSLNDKLILNVSPV